jgi:2-desacetyl-2-hydroxyethyl bacteriochlorophyllide A dehydrogenase
MKTMKYPMAKVVSAGVVEFVMRELPLVGESDVVVKVKAAAICGSDLHIFRGKHPSAALPIAIGHELAGQVIEIGSAVTKVKVGERVAIEPILSCWKCEFCRKGQYHLCNEISFQYRRGQGAFTPYFVVHENHVFKLPEGLTYEEGALIEPLAVALHAVRKSPLAMGDTCAVFGAGAIGLLIVMLLRLSGAGSIFAVDVDDFRLEKASSLGASQVFNNRSKNAVDAILAAAGETGVGLSFEAVGMALTLEQALRVLKKGGTAVLVGIFEEPENSLPVNLFVQREITLTGSQGYNWDFQAALNLLQQKVINLKPLITHTFPLADLQKGFNLLTLPGSRALKVVALVDTDQ